MRRLLAVVALGGLAAACQPASGAHPVPSVAQIGADLHCSSSDHAFEDQLAGWGFCYPGTWQYLLKSQNNASPPGFDLAFDVYDWPCNTPITAANQATCPGAGIYGFMIISTYQRGGASSLADWMQANLHPAPTTAPITWGNAQDADQFADGRRIALTPHQVVILTLRSGSGLLDLESGMSTRLSTWLFSY